MTAASAAKRAADIEVLKVRRERAAAQVEQLADQLDKYPSEGLKARLAAAVDLVDYLDGRLKRHRGEGT